MPTARIKNNFSRPRFLLPDAMGFSVPLCTVTTCETLPTDGTKSMLLGVKALTPPCLPLADQTQNHWAGLPRDARITSRKITEFSVRVHHTCRGLAGVAVKNAGICRCPYSRAKARENSPRSSLAVSLGFGLKSRTPCKLHISPHGTLSLSVTVQRKVGTLE